MRFVTPVFILVPIDMPKSDFKFLWSYSYLKYIEIDFLLSLMAGSQKLRLGHPIFFTLF